MWLVCLAFVIPMLLGLLPPQSPLDSSHLYRRMTVKDPGPPALADKATTAHKSSRLLELFDLTQKFRIGSSSLVVPFAPHHRRTVHDIFSPSSQELVLMSCWDHFLNPIYRNLASHFWDGKLHWRPQNSLMDSDDELRPEFIPFTAPYMCAAAPYDYLGFWDYPERMGWKVHRCDRHCHSGACPPGVCVAGVERSEHTSFSEPSHYGLQTPAVSRSDGGSASVAEKVAFLQAWIFFGALAEVCSLCGLTFNLEEVLISGDTISTAVLNGLPRRLFLSSQKLRLAGTKNLRRKLYAVVRRVQLVITRAGTWEDEHEYTFPECEVLYATYILLRVLSLSLLYHSPDWNLDPNDDVKIPLEDMTYDWKPEGVTRMCGLGLDKLLEKGWCKSELHLLHGDDVIVCSSFLERPAAPRNHTDCTETRCGAYQTNENDYKTAHVHIDCNCEPVPVDPNQLRQALAAERVPKVVISHDTQLSVVDGDDIPYVAISHICKCWQPNLKHTNSCIWALTIPRG